MTYIHERENWPVFRWQDDQLATLLAEVRHRQGRLLGRMEALGFALRTEASLHSLTEEVVKSSEIEGEILDKDQVRSSIARRLGLDIAGLVPADRDVEGVVDMMLDAAQNYEDPLNADRLFGWHAALFPAGRSGLTKIRAGTWRDDSQGPMQVVSGPFGREKVHYQAPPAKQIYREMKAFLKWFEAERRIDPVLKAGVAHLWFVTIHPFEDGNGRIARAIADLALARSEGTSQRFYSMSAQIRVERTAYYEMLEKTQKGDLDITEWLRWFLECLDRAFTRAEELLGSVMKKALFWERVADTSINERQRKVLNRMLNGIEGKLTSSKYAKFAKTSQDTAGRDIIDLVKKGLLTRDEAGGRSTSYSLV
ncbi:Fic family protein [Novosphingobium sp. G106]|uniref:Fic family protein n=1 Tax=Novosphingobium sp. G106 TaxID=2849500 RepID=UPI001C2CD320|nr:Fic family protein [Novosphingobium sp. G106]MBV1688574.1 Fic family protein [Novosphingobium sp. G106]